MSEAPSTPEESPPRPPDDFRVSYAQILRFQERLRHAVLELRTDLDSPAFQTIVRALEDDHGSRVARPVARVRDVLDELIRTADAASSDVSDELRRASGASELEEGCDGIPAGLARFVAERASMPGFGYDAWKDPLRGWTIDWVEKLEDGSIRASGRLYERPHAWFQE